MSAVGIRERESREESDETNIYLFVLTISVLYTL